VKESIGLFWEALSPLLIEDGVGELRIPKEVYLTLHLKVTPIIRNQPHVSMNETCLSFK